MAAVMKKTGFDQLSRIDAKNQRGTRKFLILIYNKLKLLHQE